MLADLRLRPDAFMLLLRRRHTGAPVSARVTYESSDVVWLKAERAIYHSSPAVGGPASSAACSVSQTPPHPILQGHMSYCMHAYPFLQGHMSCLTTPRVPSCSMTCLVLQCPVSLRATSHVLSYKAPCPFVQHHMTCPTRPRVPSYEAPIPHVTTPRPTTPEWPIRCAMATL